MTDSPNQKINWRITPESLFLIIGIFGILFLFSGEILPKWQYQTGTIPSAAEEIEAIKQTIDLNSQVRLYRSLIERVGPVQAQDDLYHSGLPFDGQTHLLNHVVGDYLYQKFGTAGLSKCRDYFLASCYHGFILHALASGGMTEVKKVMESCRTNGMPVFVQCAHAMGHAFLALMDYTKLPMALQLCDQVKDILSDFPVFNCQDGVFMENIWGMHEGHPSSKRWVKVDDPVYPCNDKQIDQKYLLACWSNQPSLMYQLFNRDIAKIGQECLKLTDQELQQMCFNGLARQINPIAAGDTQAVFDLCGQLPVQWVNYCVMINATSFFSVGDRTIPFDICARIDSTGKSVCYQGLFGSISAYVKNPLERSALCQKIKDK